MLCLKDLLQTTVLGSVVEFWIPLVSNSSNTSGSTVGSTLNFISPLQGSGGFYLYFGFFSTSPQDWVLDHHKVPLTTPNSYTTLQRSTDNFFLSCTVHTLRSSSSQNYFVSPPSLFAPFLFPLTEFDHGSYLLPSLLFNSYN